MNRHLLVCVALASASAFAPLAGLAADTLESIVPWETGDRASFKWFLNGKTLQLEEEVTAADGHRFALSQRTADRAYEVAGFSDDLRWTRGPCLSNGQQCAFDPGVGRGLLPLAKGRKWRSEFSVTGETFKADVVQEREVEAVETVKLGPGPFQTWRVGFSGRVKGTDSKGSAFTGKESGTEWWAVTGSGKLVLVKFAYRNSFGEKATREIVSLGYR